MYKKQIWEIRTSFELRTITDGLAPDYIGSEEFKIMVTIDNPINEMVWDIEAMIFEELELNENSISSHN